MHLFAYGTLMSPEILHAVSGLSPASIAATLDNFQRYRVKNEPWPAIISCAESQVTGVLYFNITWNAWRRLDDFEGPMYQRIKVHIISESKSYEAYTYAIAPDYLDHLEDTVWKTDDFTEGDKEKFIRSHNDYCNQIKN